LIITGICQFSEEGDSAIVDNQTLTIERPRYRNFDDVENQAIAIENLTRWNSAELRKFT